MISNCLLTVKYTCGGEQLFVYVGDTITNFRDRISYFTMNLDIVGIAMNLDIAAYKNRVIYTQMNSYININIAWF